VPFGYRTDPEHPRDPQGLRVEEYEAAIVRQMFAFYLEQGATLGTIARRLMEGGVLTPTGKRSWARRSPLAPVGAGLTVKRRPKEEWIPVSVPKIVERETFDLV
jgi:site-specific DNA recombinase